MSNKITVINRMDDTICVGLSSMSAGYINQGELYPYSGTATVAPGVVQDIPITSSADEGPFAVGFTTIVSSGGHTNPFDDGASHCLIAHNIALGSIVTIASTVSVQGAEQGAS